MLCGGNFVSTEALPCQKLLEASAFASMVILPSPGSAGAADGDGRARGVVMKRRSCAELPDA